jgi:hypothetical protein
MSAKDESTLEEESEVADKVRRSIFIPQALEASLARLAEERGTTTNDLICDMLTQAVADQWPAGADSGPGLERRSGPPTAKETNR